MPGVDPSKLARDLQAAGERMWPAHGSNTTGRDATPTNSRRNRFRIGRQE